MGNTNYFSEITADGFSPRHRANKHPDAPDLVTDKNSSFIEVLTLALSN